MLELVFTSAKAGLIPGRSGFCSVAWTEGMPQNLINLLENMSGYNALYQPNDPRALQNPVSCAYQKVQYGQKELYILSRIAFAGLDYTGRTNKIAHHIILENEQELLALPHGPVSAFLAEGNFYTEWNEPPRLLPRRTSLNTIQTAGLQAGYWQAISGDAGWAGVVAESFLSGDDKSCMYLEYDHEQQSSWILLLIDEIARLLPPQRLREFTFNTYFTAAQNGTNCFFRAALSSCQMLPAVKRFKAKDLISLLQPPGAVPAEFEMKNSVIAARTGVMPVPEHIALQEETPAVVLTASQPYGQQGSSLNGQRSMVSSVNYEMPGGEESSRGKRQLVFAVIVLFVFLLIGGAVAFGIHIGSQSASRDKDDDDKTESEEKGSRPAKGKDHSDDPADDPAQGPAGDPPADDPAQGPAGDPPADGPAQGPAGDPPADGPAQGPAGAPPADGPAQGPADEKTPKPDPVGKQEMPVDCSYALFRGYLKNSEVIDLPALLKAAHKIDLVLKLEWEDDVKLPSADGFVKHVSEKEIRILPVADVATLHFKPDPKSENAIIVKLEDGALKITGGTSGVGMPVKEYIVSVTFYVGQAEYTWTIGWNPAFVDLVAFGTFREEDFTYKRSEDETLFYDNGYLSIKKESESFKSLQDLLAGWEREIQRFERELKKAEDAEKDYKAPASWDEIWKAYRELLEMLLDPQTTVEFDPAKEKLDALYVCLCAMDDKAGFDAMKKYFKDQLKAEMEKNAKAVKDKKEELQKLKQSNDKDAKQKIQDCEAELARLKFLGSVYEKAAIDEGLSTAKEYGVRILAVVHEALTEKMKQQNAAADLMKKVRELCGKQKKNFPKDHDRQQKQNKDYLSRKAELDGMLVEIAEKSRSVSDAFARVLGGDSELFKRLDAERFKQGKPFTPADRRDVCDALLKKLERKSEK